jgi:hypothetical protein
MTVSEKRKMLDQAITEAQTECERARLRYLVALATVGCLEEDLDLLAEAAPLDTCPANL